MQILIITCWQGHISINWIGDGIQNCCNYCNFLANCRVGSEYFTSNKWKTVFRLKLVYSILDILFYISGAFCSQAGLCFSAVRLQKCCFVLFCAAAPPTLEGCGVVPVQRQRLNILGWGLRTCWDFCLSIQVAMLPLLFVYRSRHCSSLLARERLARSGPAGKVMFIWILSSPVHKHSLYFACGRVVSSWIFPSKCGNKNEAGPLSLCCFAVWKHNSVDLFLFLI